MKFAFMSNRTQFDGDSLEKKGLGGSESALINLTRALKRLIPDCKIIVYNGEREPTEYNGILYKSVRDFYCECRSFKQDVFISLRGPEPFSVPYIDSKVKVLWSQDDMNELGLQDLQNNRYSRANIDFFLAISNYAKREIEKGFPEKKVYLQRNGYNANLISDNNFKNQRTPIAVYSSTPYRGLDVLTELWPRIFEKCADKLVSPVLKVFSGMDLYGWSDSPFKPLYDVLNSMASIGVRLIGPIPQANLYKELQYCKVMAYPNHFLETGCMAVLEAIACGVWVVTTNLGALNEQVISGYNGCLIEGDSHSKQYKDKFVEETANALCNDLSFNDNSKYVFSWDQQAKNLIDILRNELWY